MARANDPPDRQTRSKSRRQITEPDQAQQDVEESLILDEDDLDLTASDASRVTRESVDTEKAPFLQENPASEEASQPLIAPDVPNGTSLGTKDGEANSAKKQLCPRCMQDVDGFVEQVRGNDSQYICPACSETVQFRYARDYAQVSRIKLSLAGMSGHGKTMFLRGIYTQLTSLGRKWRGFHFSPLSDDDARVFNTAIGDTGRGELADPSQLTERPVGFQLNGIPGAGNVHLLLSDISGEAFDTASKLKRHAFFIPKSEVVTFILSLSDVDSGHDLAFLLSRLVDTIRGKDEEPAEKSLVVVLTKGDRLRQQESLPASAEAFLSTEATADPRDLNDLQKLSDDLEEWLISHPNDYWNFVEAARSQFKNVRYTLISSTGSEAGPSGVQVQMNPRNVLSPLLWLLRFSLPAINVQGNGLNKTFYDIGDAFEAASGSPSPLITVTIDRGEYHLKQSVDLRTNIRLAGAGPGLTSIFVRSKEAEIRVSAGSFAATGISFLAIGNVPGTVVSLANTKLEISNCKFSGGRRDLAKKTLGHGLNIAGRSSGAIDNCQFTDNEGNGLHAGGTAKLTVLRCVSTLNGVAGLRFGNNSSVHASQNQSFHNEQGIRVSGEARGELSDNICCNNQIVGICYTGQSTGIARKNSCGNDSRLSDRTEQIFGFRLLGQSTVDIIHNKCLRNQGDGIRVEEDAVPSIRENLSRGNAHHGIAIHQRGSAVIELNQCRENACGIYVEKTAKGTTIGKKNDCSQSRQYDIKDLRSWRWLIQ